MMDGFVSSIAKPLSPSVMEDVALLVLEMSFMPDLAARDSN